MVPAQVAHEQVRRREHRRDERDDGRRDDERDDDEEDEDRQGRADQQPEQDRCADFDGSRRHGKAGGDLLGFFDVRCGLG